MSIFKGDVSVAGAWLILLLSVYQGVASFIYMIKKFKSSKRVENILMFLCSLTTIMCSVSYILILTFLQKEDALPSNENICKASATMFKTAVIVNKCFCSLIFSFRYVALNQSGGNGLSITRRASALTFGIIVVSLFQLIFDHTYTSFISAEKSGLYLNVDFNQHIFYVLLMLGCYFLTTVLQTVIFIETLRLKCNHVENNVSNQNLQKKLKRIAMCTLVFSVSDLLLVVLQVVLVKLIKRQLPIVLLININLNCVSLSCSYEEYRSRLFPFFKSCSTMS